MVFTRRPAVRAAFFTGENVCFLRAYLVKYMGKIYFYIGDSHELRKMHP